MFVRSLDPILQWPCSGRSGPAIPGFVIEPAPAGDPAPEIPWTFRIETCAVRFHIAARQNSVCPLRRPNAAWTIPLPAYCSGHRTESIARDCLFEAEFYGLPQATNSDWLRLCGFEVAMKCLLQLELSGNSH